MGFDELQAAQTGSALTENNLLRVPAPEWRHIDGRAAVAAIALTATANADDDPDVSRYPAPELHPQTTGCVTIHGKSTIGPSLYVSRICVGDTARAQDIGMSFGS